MNNNETDHSDYTHDNTYYPWLDEKGWQNGQITSSARTMLYFSLFFALFWNAIAFPISYFAIMDVYRGWNIEHLDPVLFVLLFPAVGIGLLFWCYKVYRQWAAFGRLALTLDPYPASIGGEVGGYLELPLTWRSDYDFEVTINCIHHRITHSGKNSRHHQDVVWKNFAAVDYEPSAKGIRVTFKCPVEDELYESEAATGRSYYRWIVHLKGHDQRMAVSLDRQFDIPVFKLDTPRLSHLHIKAAAPEVAVEQISDEQVKVKQHTRALELDYPRARNASVGTGLLIVAVIFLAVTGFLFYETWSGMQRSSGSFSVFSVGITGMMSLIFGCVSLLMLGYAVHLLSHRLRVLIDTNGIKVHSRSLLYHSEKTAQLSEIKAIDKKSTMSSGQGVSATRYFTLTAYLHDNQRLTLGSGIKGQLTADSLLKLINKQLGSSRGKPSISGSKIESSLPFDKAIPEKAFKNIKLFKIIINAIGFIIILFFILQFFSFWTQ